MNITDKVKRNSAFVCKDGSVILDLSTLAGKLSTIKPDTYFFHVTPKKNDFYNWIRDVYGQKVLAEKVKKANNSRDAAKIIKTALQPNQIKLLTAPKLLVAPKVKRKTSSAKTKNKESVRNKKKVEKKVNSKPKQNSLWQDFLRMLKLW